MKRIILLLYIGLCSMIAFGQGLESPPKSEFDLFSKSTIKAAEKEYNQVTEGTLININLTELAALRESAPRKFDLEVPLNEEESLELKLEKVRIFSKDFKVETSSRNSVQDIDLGVHYRGTLAGHTTSLVSLSIYKDELVGLISDGRYDYELVKLKDDASRYILYKIVDLEQRIKDNLFNFQCHTESTGKDLPRYTEDQLFGTNRSMMACKVIEVYLVGDLDFYEDNGSDVGASTIRLTSVFAQTINIYNAESIYMKLSGIFIWVTEDGLGDDDAEIHRNNFRNYYNGAGAGWPGDLAQLISGRGSGNSGAGGIAFFNGLCTSDSYAITRVGANAAIADWTSYSRFVKVLTHEIGHNLNSVHTHNCGWNGDNTTIDDYGNISVSTGMPVTNDDGDNVAEGRNCISPPYKLSVFPTIMSYFDSFGWNNQPGADPFNMTNGMGTQPGNVMRNYVANASCLGNANLEISCDLVNDITVACIDDVPDTDLVVILDACGVVTVTPSTITSGGNGCPGQATIVTQTFSVEDGAGNLGACERTITVVSNNGPTISCPAGGTITCAADLPGANIAGVVATSECSTPDITVSGPVQNGPDDCSATTFTYTYTATDDCGRSVSCDQVYIIANDPPTIVCPANESVACFEDITINANDAVTTTSCNLGSTVTVAGPVVNGEENCAFTTYTYTYTVIDDCGRSAQCQQIFTINSSSLSISCPAPENVECAALIDADPEDATVNANCNIIPVVTVSEPVINGTPDCPGTTYTYTYSATSPCFANPVACERVFTIQNDPPQIVCPPPATVECVTDIVPDITLPNVFTSCLLGSTVTFTGPTLVDGLPDCPGTTYAVVYTVTDECGRTAECTQIFTIQNDGPEIVCPADMVVECAVDIVTDPADAVVTTSCTLGFETVVTGPVVGGLEDCPGTTYTYTYTTTDDCGRSASCEQVFTIDNEGPVIVCPADQTVECAFDIVVDANDAVVTTSCTLGFETVVNGPVVDGPANCPGTTYTYTYTTTDDCGRIAQCEQVFTIGDNDAPTITVVPNITVDCFESINPDPALADVTTACNNGVDFEVTVSDPVLGFGLNCPGETYSVVYTVTDACGRTANATQTFIIANDGPTMECPDNCEVLTCYEGDYEAIIEAWINTVEATSSCSVDLTVFNTYNGVNGICVDNGFTPVTFSATDACGRSVSCESGIFITDTDAPDIYETPEDLLVPCTANTEQIFSDWLADYGGAEAVDACGGPVTWSADTGVNALNCANGPQAIVVTFTATDGCGNSASVVGTFNTKLLPDAVNVAGLIQTEAAEAVASVEVAAYQSSGMTEMDMSTQTGDYHFEELPYEENTDIVPNKDDDYLNGVTTYDLILLQQHILGIQTLNSPYKQIAADANRSGTISTLDLVLLRRLILHIDEELADNTSWRFVDADFVFPNPADPFETDFPEVYTLSGLEEELKDFVAVKIGDLNLDAATNNFNQSEDRSGLDNLEVIAEDQKLATGQTYEVSLSAANFASINGFQFTLNVDQTAVEILDIESADLADFNNMNYGMSKLEEGAVTISWNTNTAESLASTDAMFKVVLRATANVQLSEVLSITSSYTKAEAYQGGDLMNVSLNFSDNGTIVTAQTLRLYQNQPNPFKDATMIGFDLPKAGAVDFMIYDLTGKLVYRAQGDYAAGYNQIEVDRSDLPNGGVFYYHINTDEDAASKKMIIID